jgi:hypothetical protein
MAVEEKRNRNEQREALLQVMPKGGIVAEIGVWEGEFSHRILDVCKPAKLHLIDPWQFMPEFRNTCFGRLKNEFLMDEKYAEVKATFAKDARVEVHRATSEEALMRMPDHSLDWVYVDGNHNEPYVTQDIEMCLHKVKPCGVIAGDDFNWKAFALGGPVRRAVEGALRRLGDQASFERFGSQWIIRLNRPDAKPVDKPARIRRAA